jgi:DNA-binding CsgD family transcriptional regulator
MKVTIMADSERYSREEIRLAKLLRQGVTREAIARNLDMDPAEVVTRVRQLIEMIGAKDRNDLLAELDNLSRLDE